MIKKIQINFAAILTVIFLFGAVQFAQGIDYPKLSEKETIFQGDAGKWDADKVHTLSVVEANKDGYKYWGYYGLSYYGGDPTFRKAGLVRSNDLKTWTKYEGNPLINGDCRWPSAVYTNGKFYLFYAEYDSVNDSRIVMVSSKDGIHFDNKTVIVAREKDKQNQNPNIIYNKKDKCFYLSYYHGFERQGQKVEGAKISEENKNAKNYWSIKLKKTKNIENWNNAKPKTLLYRTDYTIASPSLAFYNNKYYLLIESILAGKWNDKWVTLAYASDKIDGKYTEVKNNPVLSDDDACAFQHVFNNQLYIFYSHCLNPAKWDWELKMVKAVK